MHLSGAIAMGTSALDSHFVGADGSIMMHKYVLQISLITGDQLAEQQHISQENHCAGAGML
jgi:hypothetical protein